MYMNYRLLWCINLVIFFSTNYEANTSGANANTNSAATQARTNSWENSNYIAYFENLNPERIAILNELIQNRTTPLHLDDVMTFEGLRCSDLLYPTQSNTHPQIITYNRQNRQIQISNKYISFDDIQKLVTDYYQIFLLKYGLQNSELLTLLEKFNTNINETATDALSDVLDISSIAEKFNDPMRSCILSNRNIYAFICYAYVIYQLQSFSESSEAFVQNNAINQAIILKCRANSFSDFLQQMRVYIFMDMEAKIQEILVLPFFEEYLQQENGKLIIVHEQEVRNIIEEVINEMKLYYDNLFAHECSILRKFIKRSITS